MLDQIDWDFAGADDARAQIGAAVQYLLRDATDNRVRGDIVWKIIEIVHDVANGLPPPPRQNPHAAGAVKQPAMSGIAYKAYVIDTYQRDKDQWRATVRRSNGKKIRVAVPPSVQDEATTSADALTAEKAVELAKKLIDGGGLI
jgi:hypothetical protein